MAGGAKNGVLRAHEAEVHKAGLRLKTKLYPGVSKDLLAQRRENLAQVQSHVEEIIMVPNDALAACAQRLRPSTSLGTCPPKERVLFIGTQFSILYTFMYSPAEAASYPEFCRRAVICRQVGQEHQKSEHARKNGILSW